MVNWHDQKFKLLIIVDPQIVNTAFFCYGVDWDLNSQVFFRAQD